MKRLLLVLAFASALLPLAAQDSPWQVDVYESQGTAEIEIPGRGWLQAVTGRTVPPGARLATWVGAQSGFVLVPGEDQGAAVVTLDELAVMMLSEATDELTFELLAGVCSVTVEGQALTLVAGAARIRALNASFSVGDGLLSVTEGSVELDLRGARVVGAGASVSLLPTSNSALLGK